MTRFDSLLETLTRSRVDFIVVGGAAGIAHGSARFTQDLDVVYGRSRQNLHRVGAEGSWAAAGATLANRHNQHSRT